MNRLNYDLRCQAVRLETINKELEAFSYTVSHDLRNPLLGINGFCHILLEKHSTSLDQQGQKFLDMIHSSTQQMLKLVDDLLIFSIGGNQQMKSSSIDMDKLPADVFEELERTVPERTLQLNLKMPPPACGDPGMIRQVLFNLISNAIKFTRSREVGSIEMGGYAKESGNVYYVRDNGIGFDMESSDKLFIAFQRLSNRSGIEGTGLGLAIVRRIINRHGGKVWAEGEIGKGATFYFSLPQIPPCEGQMRNN
jgi:light-regulated signal transduction histidine kinase (bacteriophytochrome)